MAEVVLPAWLCRRDPDLVALRRAARVAVVAGAGFYLGRYGLGDPVLGLYALFGAVALGGLAQVPGAPAEKARVLLALMPVGYALVALGTLLAVRDWAAALGMFVLGFALSYAGVCGARLAGLATGMQLLYILPCFPPYAPGTLGSRLAGLTVAVLLLAVAEWRLWPDPAPVPYPSLLADAAGTLADRVADAADALAGDRTAGQRLAAGLPAAARAAQAVRPSRLPLAERPAGPGRRDRALGHAGGAVRYVLARVVDLAGGHLPGERDEPAGGTAPAAVLLVVAARTVRAAAAALRGQAPAPGPDDLAAAMAAFRRHRRAAPVPQVRPGRLWCDALAYAVADGVEVFATTVRTAVGGTVPRAPAAAFDQHWYAHEPAVRLWWRRLLVHLTPRSVHFQWALRLALALAVARLLAGAIEIAHGFWMLLAILTLMRAATADARYALRQALIGTAAGAVVAAALLAVVSDELVYTLVLLVLLVPAFATGTMFGVAAGQALFTLLVATIFAQIGPAHWTLAEVRALDVLLGGTVGVLIGLLAWPHGAAGELRRATADLLDASAATIRATARKLADASAAGPPVRQARRPMLFAEASFAAYLTERRAAQIPAIDWHAALVAAHHAVRGAEALLRSCPPGRLRSCGTMLRRDAYAVADGYLGFAASLRRGRQPVKIRFTLDDRVWPAQLGADLCDLADVRVWLAGLATDLGRASATPHAGPPPGGGTAG